MRASGVRFGNYTCDEWRFMKISRTCHGEGAKQPKILKDQRSFAALRMTEGILGCLSVTLGDIAITILLEHHLTAIAKSFFREKPLKRLQKTRLLLKTMLSLICAQTSCSQPGELFSGGTGSCR